MSTTLEDLDDAYESAPAAPPPSRGYVKLPELADGAYTVVLAKAQVKEVNNSPVVEMTWLVDAPADSAGLKFNTSYWLKTAAGDRNERAIGELRRDLATLGADPDQWTRENGRPFSATLPLALAAMHGVKAHCRKWANVSRGNGRTYQNFAVNRRAPGDGRPAKFGPAEIAAAAADPIPAGGGDAGDDGIPF